MSNEITKREAGAVGQVSGASWQTMVDQARVMLKSGFLPQAIRTPEQAVAIAMTGKELGLGMMQSFRSINVIQGKPTLSANLMLALAQKTGEFENQALEIKPDRVIYKVKRKGQEWHTEEFGDKEAAAMQLIGKDNYKKQKSTMYKWRAVSNALRFVFGDVLHGIYTPEELGANVEVNDDGDTKIVSIPQTETKDEVKSPEEKTAEASEPKTPQMAVGEKDTLNIVIEEVEERMSKGNAAKKVAPKKFCWVHDTEGAKYFCYSSTANDILKEAKGTGALVEVEIEMTNYGAKILDAKHTGVLDAQEVEDEPNE